MFRGILFQFFKLEEVRPTACFAIKTLYVIVCLVNKIQQKSGLRAYQNLKETICDLVCQLHPETKGLFLTCTSVLQIIGEH